MSSSRIVLVGGEHIDVHDEDPRAVGEKLQPTAASSTGFNELTVHQSLYLINRDQVLYIRSLDD